MRAAKEAGVQRICITSSVAAIFEQEPEDQPEIYNETHWTDVNKRGLGSYEKSKTLAERAAWEFMEALPENERFGLSTVNPGFITGPTLINGGFASAEIIGMYMNNKFPGGLPQVQMPIVDVRDVAQAHVNCIKNE